MILRQPDKKFETWAYPVSYNSFNDAYEGGTDMKWLDLLKEGASRAADKAQRTVEITRTAANIAGKRKQIRSLHGGMGAAVYEAYREGDFTAAAPEVVRISALIESLEREIGALELELQRLNKEKTCACGKVVPYGARFCPDCGKRFETAPEMIEEAVEVEATLRCVRCDTELDIGDRFCLRCGSDQTEDALVRDPDPDAQPKP
ncbi:zinc ribbon domain-containing protein [Paenibacillus oceani]|uniref:Zinc ribbon domain-containing protein n=1 Tax=Paenibacillus oceani TaxID=2772510 RepID=A0A927GYE9_9BACL|nr:zinc ribbon domain-containing protein [Paenibacillus oceani]MBD2860972.1 zinc ribbon domain-containing protein [Paenibacillus oceani]